MNAEPTFATMLHRPAMPPPSLWVLPSLVLTAAPLVAVLGHGVDAHASAPIEPFAAIAPLIGSWCAWRARGVAEPTNVISSLERSAQVVGTLWSLLLVGLAAFFVLRVAIFRLNLG